VEDARPAVHVGNISLSEAELSALLRALKTTQEDIATAIADDRMPVACPSFDAALRQLRSTLVKHEAAETASLVEFLLSKIVSDTTSLHFAASTK
jgi:hypothetical protein